MNQENDPKDFLDELLELFLSGKKRKKSGDGDDKDLEDLLRKLETDRENSKIIIRALRRRIKECEERGQKLDRANKAYAKALERLTKIAKQHEQAEKSRQGAASKYGVFIRPHPGGDADEVDILVDDEMRKVHLAMPGLSAADLKCGWEVLLDPETGNIVGLTKKHHFRGSVVSFKEKLNDEEALVSGEGGSLFQCFLSPELKDQKLKDGDYLLNYNGLLLKLLPKVEGAERFFDIEEIRDKDWSHVGGLSRAVKKIKRSLLPFKIPEVYAKFKGKNPPKGLILHGPEGCGKTLLAQVIAADVGKSRGLKVGFMQFAGADLTDKFVGETARKMREIFARAKELASQGWLVIVFIDEIDSLLRSRDTASHEPWMGTDIGQFNAILQGMDPLGNVLVIGATNRKDLIDKAILRPGRLGVDVEVPRPRSEKDIKEILRIHLTADMPFASKYFEQDTYTYIDHFGSGEEQKVELKKDPENVRNHIIDMITNRILYTGSPVRMHFEDGEPDSTIVDNRFRAITQKGEEDVYLKDWLSGAILASIVENARLIALERYNRLREENPSNAKEEVMKKDFFRAVDEEMRRLKNSFLKVKEKPLGFKPKEED